MKLTNVVSLNKQQAWAVSGELFLDAADPGLGFGQNVLKLQVISVHFLENGAMLAPTFLQAVGLGNDDDDPKLNTSTIDVYYVPKLSDPKTLLTFDPNVTYDWETEMKYGSLAVTIGRALGKAGGGNLIGFVKPTIFVGNDRSGDWGVEAGIKIVGF
ncbi:hypothetical protein [Tabrizicola sp. BL-A-41-H6]|uniref:hypothetical protein n=1 Tax=Tabrizicola sp. BL-A-41-H6 TaxID=3421107 RepID=UPI003D669F41